MELPFSHDEFLDVFGAYNSMLWPAVVPVLWAAIGGSAAFVLGIRADLALVVAGALLTLDTLAPSALGEKAEV